MGELLMGVRVVGLTLDGALLGLLGLLDDGLDDELLEGEELLTGDKLGLSDGDTLADGFFEGFELGDELTGDSPLLIGDADGKLLEGDKLLGFAEEGACVAARVVVVVVVLVVVGVVIGDALGLLEDNFDGDCIGIGVANQEKIIL